MKYRQRKGYTEADSYCTSYSPMDPPRKHTKGSEDSCFEGTMAAMA